MTDEERKNMLRNTDSSEKRLRLKKDCKESIDKKTHFPDDSNNDYRNDHITCTSESSCVDDSIVDFKSPRKIHTEKLKNINNDNLIDKSNRKAQRSKLKIINTAKKSERNKRPKDGKLLHDVQQPLIESTFFKSDKKIDSLQNSVNVKTAYVCPLCFKNLKDEDLQTAHMKNCAIKNNVTTKKLLDAMELQERQAAERKSLGLLSAPVLQDKKKSTPRKMESHEDPDLQLALALSKSLYEKEEREKWDEAEIVAISSNTLLVDNVEEYPQKTTLQSFGFTSNKSISPVNNFAVNKIKKRRKPIDPTILQKRTTIERERILTDRIAEVLIGRNDFTQRIEDETEHNSNAEEKIIIKNPFLQRLRQTENTLWDRTELTSSQNIFYVAQLSSHVPPLLQKSRKLSGDENIQSTDENLNNKNSSNKQEVEIQVDKAHNNIQSISSSDVIKTCCSEKQFLDTLAINWGNILNDSSASDIIIFVQNDKHIWTHKLVFYVRCTNILLDITPNDTKFSTAKEKINWTDIDYDVALAFLEFVYCGIINKYSKILYCDASVCNIRYLARKYKMSDLFAYLRQKTSKANEIKYDDDTYQGKIENIHENVENTSNCSNEIILNTSIDYVHNDLKNIHSSQETFQNGVNNTSQSSQYCHIPAEDACISQDKAILTKSLGKINCRSNASIRSEINASPDIFDDTLDVNDESIRDSQNHEDSNLHVLLNLIKQDMNIDNCGNKPLSQSTEHSRSGEDVSSISLKNVKQNITVIDVDVDSNSVKSFTDDLHKDSIIDTPKKSKSSYIKDYPSSNVVKQKSNLTLFIEKMQKENAKSDSDIDSDMDYSLHISPIQHENPFHVNRHNNIETDSDFHNVEKNPIIKGKQSRLSIIEQCIQSNANKNTEFYSRLSNEHADDMKRTNILHTTPIPFENTTGSSYDNMDNCLKNIISPDEKHINISKESRSTPLSPSSSNTPTMDQSLNTTSENTFDPEADISMYSRYMKNHKNNSIAKYREAIKDIPDNNSSNESIVSISTNKNSESNRNHKTIAQCISSHKVSDVISSSEKGMSSVNCCSVDSEDDFDEDFEQERIVSSARYRKKLKDREQDINNKGINQSNKIEKIAKVVTTELEQEEDAINIRRSNRDKFNINDKELTPDDITDCNMVFTQTEFKSHETNQNNLDNHKEKFIPSPIMVSSSPDFSSSEELKEQCNKFISGMDNLISKKSTNFVFNFERDIYLGNVNVDKYDKLQHSLEKSRSSSTLSIAEFKKDNRCTFKNKRSRDNIINSNTITNNFVSDCANLHNNDVGSTNIKKLGKKSLSEGQIIINKPHNSRTISKHISMQSQCNNSKLSNIRYKIFNKDVTPPPDYNGMTSPELHKNMSKYGLKVQNRSKAVKLLTHIYDTLHPLIPATEIETEQEIVKILSDDDTGPPLKRPKISKDDLVKLNSVADDNDKLCCSQDSNRSIDSVKSITHGDGTEMDLVRNEMEFYETESLPVFENSSNITEAFKILIDIDKDLHNKILQYEPVNIEQLHFMLRTRGVKCSLSNLMRFLDEQCITFYIPEQNIRSRTRKEM